MQQNVYLNILDTLKYMISRVTLKRLKDLLRRRGLKVQQNLRLRLLLMLYFLLHYILSGTS